ncbi:hypothetical protein PRIPAC_76394, partial [Pristionchus pacificus]
MYLIDFFYCPIMDEMEMDQNMSVEEPFEFDDIIGDAPVVKKTKVSGDNENEISSDIEIKVDGMGFNEMD